ncbi:phage major tail tube protein [Tepidanaerobacter acetatoxydans]|uniref:phage major tail tube protein n=1 Tax=Tepidanaerobacter acetatoxydans TaxID=499229 RepID=UPI0026EF3BBD|nr:phage major tail tube protein [Tepidanaerobacter acetatoxydans]
MRIPDRLIGYRVYKEGKFIATADVELPDIEHMTETLSGAGIAGEIEMPALGQIGSMTTTINFRTQTNAQIELLEPRGTMLDFRGSLQEYDSGAGKIVSKAVKVTMNVLPKTTGLGKFEVGTPTDSSSELEVTYLKMFIDNKEVLEIDKTNYIYKVNGKDYLEEIRQQLGM